MTALTKTKILLVLAGVALSAGRGRAFDHSHAAFTAVLEAHVRDARVDYAALKANPNALGKYLDTLGAVPKGEFDKWSKPRQIAYLINFYNAQTLKLIIDHYPVKSIKDIGGFRGPWKLKIVHIWGGLKTLDEIEHEILRANYDEPRIHFALVCAAKGCPPLRREAYRAEVLDAQLAGQGRAFMSDTSKNRVDPQKKILHLSPIFKWFAGDFEYGSGTVEAFVIPFLPAKDAAAVGNGGFRIAYTHYDWSLNDLDKR
jgi:hypothetical protein